uniref:Uncharacterized protein n=1 Tax=Lepeophtheirus salmonis TaxID=72036 RepID=A0A0K2UJZ6_LEPSM
MSTHTLITLNTKKLSAQERKNNDNSFRKYKNTVQVTTNHKTRTLKNV